MNPGDLVEIINNGGCYTSSTDFAKKLDASYFVVHCSPPNGTRGIVIKSELIEDTQRILVSLRCLINDIPKNSDHFSSPGILVDQLKKRKNPDYVDFVIWRRDLKLIHKVIDIMIPEELFEI